MPRSCSHVYRSAGFILQNVRGGWIEDQALDRLRSVALQHKCRAPARMCIGAQDSSSRMCEVDGSRIKRWISFGRLLCSINAALLLACVSERRIHPPECARWMDRGSSPGSASVGGSAASCAVYPRSKSPHVSRITPPVSRITSAILPEPSNRVQHECSGGSRLDDWSLKFLWMLVLGIWSFPGSLRVSSARPGSSGRVGPRIDQLLGGVDQLRRQHGVRWLDLGANLVLECLQHIDCGREVAAIERGGRRFE